MTIPNISPIERVQEAAIATLNANLAAEITLINTESAGDLTVPAPPAAKYHYEQEIPEEVSVEVVPTGLRWDAARANAEWGHSRLTSEVLYDVAVTCQRDQNWTDQDWMRVLNRYGAALVRVLAIKNATLGQASTVILHTRPAGQIRYEVDPENDPGGQMVRRIVVPFSSTTQETA